MCLRLELLELLLNFYSLGFYFLNQFFYPNFFASFLLFIFSLNLHYLVHFFHNKNCQVKKIWNQKNMLVGVGGANPTI
jgi:predicted PurR-regulated permease PerM